MGTAVKIPFKGTAQQKSELYKVIEENANVRGALMTVLQKAQDIYGYLPIQVQEMIADGLGLPLEDIYGVVTFYAQFSLYPRGRNIVSVCMGTACYVKGAGDLYNDLCERLKIKDGECTPDGKWSLDACRCVGACGLAPLIIINGDPYGRISVSDIAEILKKYD
ncbi:MAG: NAD(P)H-dependent oxidoreductase subunit E [Oscillospiraceae bacterium]|nr:NAD(P)H-dependent oxidoreductase subunit E [Oscillospiraceae bacterium]